MNSSSKPTKPMNRQNRLRKPNRLEQYHVIIHCHSEAQQRELFNRLRGENLRCRLTVL
jgi:hypothetical protein